MSNLNVPLTSFMETAEGGKAAGSSGSASQAKAKKLKNKEDAKDRRKYYEGRVGGVMSEAEVFSLFKVSRKHRPLKFAFRIKRCPRRSRRKSLVLLTRRERLVSSC